MKWKKVKKIFNPLEHNLINDCEEFAQCPSVLLFEKFVRVYFCTRSIDLSSGKYLSHVSFVDFSKNFNDIIRVSKKEVLPLGGIGCFDEHGIKPFNAIRYKNTLYGFYSGLSRKCSVSLDASIGIAKSDDNGETFNKLGPGPVLTASLYEPFLIADGFVKIINDKFNIWYIFGTGWKNYAGSSEPERIYKIGHAVSLNGIDWKRNNAKQIIPSVLGPDECHSSPSVIKIGDYYHMFFGYRQPDDFRKNKDRGYKIGHAYSSDLLSWVRDDNNPSFDNDLSEWDSEMQCYPHVFELDNKVHLLYNGNMFGKFGFGLATLEF